MEQSEPQLEGVEVEFEFESGERRTRRMPAVPRVGETLVWVSTDEVPGTEPATVWTSETRFEVAEVAWTVTEPAEPGDEAPAEATVRVHLVRAGGRPTVGSTPEWMGLDEHDRLKAAAEAARFADSAASLKIG